MSDPGRRPRIDAVPPAVEWLTRAVERASLDDECDPSELREAVAACARDARRDAQPPQCFLVQIKTYVRGATVRAAPSAVGPLMSRVVQCAIEAYYDHR